VASHHVERSKGLIDPDSPDKIVANKAQGDVGDRIVNAVVQATGQLEDRFHPHPFACVLGKRLFEEAHRPVAKSMVLPSDRIIPMLGGPLLRSGKVLDDHGVVVSLAAGAIDIVVATPPRAQFLQMTDDAKYLFRVYEKFVLRIKDRERPAMQAFQVAVPPYDGFSVFVGSGS